jgi:hypothetical protein
MKSGKKIYLDRVLIKLPVMRSLEGCKSKSEERFEV